MNIRELKGIGEKTEQLFNRLNVYNTADLLNFYPRTYDVYEEPVLIGNISEEGIYAISAVVASSCELNTRSRLKVLSVMLADDMGNRIKATWFNMPFLKSQLKRGYRFIFRGKVAYNGNLAFIEQPAIYTFEEYSKKQNSMQPIYSLTAGLSNNLVIKTVKQCLLEFSFKEYLPQDILSKYELMGIDEAYRGIHFPKDFNELKPARKRIVFDEFLLFSIGVKSRKNANLLAKNNFCVKNNEFSARILANLGYELTNAQNKVFREIMEDMSSDNTMNRLVQGDVGSGKTIIAILALVNVVHEGFQGALMAPTEVLAKQHFESFQKIINDNNLNINCILLTGSLTVSAKRKAYEEISAGKADIIIGTHAVITDKVEFASLGLVVTDEQHRFGVSQREKLHEKGNRPHILVMSATPIPRSLAIILYGDLDISIIDEKPNGRLPIKNCVVDSGYRPNAYRFIKNEVDKGHQAYIICAMAKESEQIDIENVIEYTDKLRKVFDENIRIEFLHGKMKSSDKNRIMEEFAMGDIKILVSTTVVEVGINVPNATVMMIENSERFGLAGLHQLRGRIGRSDAQSYCIFVSDTKNNATKERLAILKESNDGFYVAEQDLRLRGPGDILGTRQSGEMGFLLGDIYIDASTLKIASMAASDILKDNPDLSGNEYDILREKLIYNNINL